MTQRERAKVTVAQSVIHDLAARTRRPVEEVRVVYEQQLALLESDAKVSTYLTLFAIRRTRELLTNP